VKREAYLHATQSEMAQIETAIERYHSAYGFYPPDNPYIEKNANYNKLDGSLTNQLFYELTGTWQTNINNKPYYATLDGSSTISTNDMGKSFGGVSGFMNCNKAGADESAPSARNFLPDLKPGQIGVLSSNAQSTVKLLVASVGGPAGFYVPLGQSGLNPWRYLSPGTNNPGSYDLWIQLAIGSDTNLVCNWNNQVQINNQVLP
jgi:type II secretory pathway pseudopilin PulG